MVGKFAWHDCFFGLILSFHSALALLDEALNLSSCFFLFPCRYDYSGYGLSTGKVCGNKKD